MDATPPKEPEGDGRRSAAEAALRLGDDELLTQCEITTHTAGGPGGQHRNKTESAVRLRHLPTGLVVEATERRSQHQNRGAALERLRATLARLTAVRKPRRPTRPGPGAHRRRLAAKKRTSEKKRERRGNPAD